MAPGYRNPNRRQNRPVDHDLFEGLPVRHWRRDFVTVAPPPTIDTSSSKNDIWGVELPHGMPKDYHLLPQHSQDLLRAARSGRIYKRPAPAEDDEADPEAGEKPEKKEEEPKDKGFQAKAWKQIPRHLEGPDVEYLAKRRKGVITLGAKAGPTIPTLTKATVKRIDAAGNEYVQDVVVPHGQQVEGELISVTEIPDPNAVGPDGLAVLPTPPRRKPMGRKKLKGPGRGRKKKILAPTSVPDAGQLAGVASTSNESGPVGADGVKIENVETTQPQRNEDTEMADGSIAASDNDSSDDGEEGEEGEDDEGSVDNQASPSKPPHQDDEPQGDLPTTEAIPDIPPLDTTMSGLDNQEPDTSVGSASKEIAGSPLKQVALTTSVPVSPKEEVIETPPQPVSIEKTTDASEEVAAIGEVMQQQVAETAPQPLPSPPPHPIEADVQAVVEERKEEEAEEQALLDIVENANAQLPEPETAGDQNEGEPPETNTDAPASNEAVKSPIEPPQTAEEPVTSEPQAEVKDVSAENCDDDDDFPDLLGDLEKSLDKPSSATEAVKTETEGLNN